MNAWPLLQEWKADLPAGRKEEIKRSLSQYLNHLLLHDFGALVQLLYRVDVSETNVKAVLQQYPDTDAGDLLANLLIQRQEEKNATLQSSQRPAPESDEERW